MDKQPRQSRKWQLTINNPQDKGLDHAALKKALEQFKSCVYWCMADEIGLDTHTPHTHLFMALKSPAQFALVKKRFPEAHIEAARGTVQENRAYVQKSGKWADDPKADTSVPGTFEESGEPPEESGQGARTDIALIYQQIEEGLSNAAIMQANPNNARYIHLMDKVRQDILEARYREHRRELDVTYIFGPTETGKTRGVYDKHGYGSVYRVTDYEHPFDRHAQEPVMCFDEFRSSLQIGDMLDYLDSYPLNLPARYSQRVACFETVYIISNIKLSQQYPNVQLNEPETWKAFLRRIHHVIEYQATEPPIDHGPAMDYIFSPPAPVSGLPPSAPVSDWVEITEPIELPFP